MDVFPILPDTRLTEFDKPLIPTRRPGRISRFTCAETSG